MKTLVFICSLLLSTIAVGKEGRTTLEATLPSLLPVLIESAEGKKEIIGSSWIYKRIKARDGQYVYYAATARHVVGKADVKKIHIGEHKPFIIMAHKSKDVAIALFKSDKLLPVLPLSSSEPRVGTECVLYGWALGIELFSTQGRYLGYSHTQEGLMKSDADSINGMSGGPFICEGKVVGILYGGWRQRDTLTSHPIAFLTYLTPTIDGIE